MGGLAETWVMRGGLGRFHDNLNSELWNVIRLGALKVTFVSEALRFVVSLFFLSLSLSSAVFSCTQWLAPDACDESRNRSHNSKMLRHARKDRHHLVECP